MHEVSLCQSMRLIAERASKGRKVTAVSVDVGALRQVVPAALDAAWGAVAKQSMILTGSHLEIRLIPASFDCKECGRHTTLQNEVIFQCGCGSRNIIVRSGEEFMITSIDVAD
ncbi:hydrogenase maturation nickel metallochaperone HypA [Arcanobacterium hippocoleae]